jgi:hypothetical protein
LNNPSRDELDRFLKHRGVLLEYTFEDFEHEHETSVLSQKRRRDLGKRPQF